MLDRPRVVRFPGRGRRYDAELRALADAGLLVRICRPSRWGNPFRIGPDGDRTEVVAKHRAWLDGEGPDELAAGRTTVSRAWVLEHLHELAGKVLGCRCYPERCHGDTLADRVEIRSNTRSAISHR
jgi:hypothetical protein